MDPPGVILFGKRRPGRVLKKSRKAKKTEESQNGGNQEA